MSSCHGPTTELAEFQALCSRLGIAFHMWHEDGMLAYDDEGAYVCGPPEAAGAHAWLMLGQSHLFFDIQGRFLGLRWDDMGDWEPRQPVEEPHA